MNVLIVDSMTPFAGGDHDLSVEPLTTELVALGHDIEVLRIPISREPAERALSQVLLVRWLEIEYVDHVIALGYPACLVRHERKAVWLQFENSTSHFPPGYLQSDPATVHDTPSLQSITATMNGALAEARNVYVDSLTGQQCLQGYLSCAVDVITVPAGEPAAPGWAAAASELLR